MPKAEIIPADEETPVDDRKKIDRVNLEATRDNRQVAGLATPGQIKQELGKVYRAAHAKKITWDEAWRRSRVMAILLAAAEMELKFALQLASSGEDGEEADDVEVFTGLRLVGPDAEAVAARAKQIQNSGPKLTRRGGRGSAAAMKAQG